MDPMTDRSQPLYAAILMTLAAAVVLGASIAGRATFSRVRRPAPKPPVVESMPEVPVAETSASVAPEPPTEQEAQKPASDPVRSFVDASVKSAMDGTGVEVRAEDAVALKEAPKDPAVQAAVGGALKASVEQSAPLFRSAMEAVWKTLTSFIKVKVTVKEETP